MGLGPYFLSYVLGIVHPKTVHLFFLQQYSKTSTKHSMIKYILSKILVEIVHPQTKTYICFFQQHSKWFKMHSMIFFQIINETRPVINWFFYTTDLALQLKQVFIWFALSVSGWIFEFWDLLTWKKVFKSFRFDGSILGVLQILASFCFYLVPKWFPKWNE